MTDLTDFDAIKIAEKGDIIDLTGMTKKDRTRLIQLLNHIVVDRDELTAESREIRHYNNILSKIAAFTTVAAIYLLALCLYLTRP